MPDNVDLPATGSTIVVKEVTHSGDSAELQCVGLVGVSGSEGSYTIADINGDATFGLDVDVTRCALPTGAASAANQVTANSSLSAIDGHVDGLETSAASIDGKIPSLGQALAAGSFPVVLTAAQLSTLTPPAAISGFLSESNFDTKAGSLTETAPATDTASSGLNGRLQRVAQRLTSLIALLPTSLGQKAKTASLAVTLASDQDAIPITDNSGSLTVDYATTGSGTSTGALRVELPTNGTGVIATVGAVTAITNALPAGSNSIGTVVSAGNVASGASDSGNPVKVGGKYNSSAPTLTDGQRGDLQLDVNGNLRVNTGALTSASDSVAAVGDIAHDGADSGNPIKVGGKAYNFDGTAPGTAVAEGDRAQFITDLEGRQAVTEVHPNSFTLFEDHTSAQTNNQLKAAPGASLSIWITDVVVSNGATAGTLKLVEDEGGTPAQVSQTLYLGINGGAVINWKTPKKLTANKSLGFTSATVTTHSIEIHGYIAP